MLDLNLWSSSFHGGRKLTVAADDDGDHHRRLDHAIVVSA
jgi:hypothetical protein